MMGTIGTTHGAVGITALDEAYAVQVLSVFREWHLLHDNNRDVNGFNSAAQGTQLPLQGHVLRG